jgi:hypothetical protein
MRQPGHVKGLGRTCSTTIYSPTRYILSLQRMRLNWRETSTENCKHTGTSCPISLGDRSSVRSVVLVIILSIHLEFVELHFGKTWVAWSLRGSLPGQPGGDGESRWKAFLPPILLLNHNLKEGLLQSPRAISGCHKHRLEIYHSDAKRPTRMFCAHNNTVSIQVGTLHLEMLT